MHVASIMVNQENAVENKIANLCMRTNISNAQQQEIQMRKKKLCDSNYADLQSVRMMNGAQKYAVR